MSSIFLINVCLFSLKMIALSDVAELNMFVARSAQPMISFYCYLLSEDTL